MKQMMVIALLGLFVTACAPDIRQQLAESQAAYASLSATATAETQSSNAAIEELSAQNAQLQADLEGAREAFEEMSKLNDISMAVAKEALEMYDCPASQTIDYTSNATVSDSLKIFVGDAGGSVSLAEWDVVWSNARAAIHKISADYLYVFLVYFDNEDLGQTNGVFWLDGACWLSH